MKKTVTINFKPEQSVLVIKSTDKYFLTKLVDFIAHTKSIPGATVIQLIDEKNADLVSKMVENNG